MRAWPDSPAGIAAGAARTAQAALFDLAAQYGAAAEAVVGPEADALTPLWRRLAREAAPLAAAVARRLRAAGGNPLMDLRDLAGLSPLPPFVPDAASGGRALAAMLARANRHARSAVEACAEGADPGTAHLVGGILLLLDRQHWEVRRHLADGG
jgi:DNA-binding ferritin-like protein